MNENHTPRWYRETEYIKRNPSGKGTFIIALDQWCHYDEVDELIADANRTTETEIINQKLIDACKKIGEMGMYTIGPSNAHRIIYEMARLAQVALAETQKPRDDT